MLYNYKKNKTLQIRQISKLWICIVLAVQRKFVTDLLLPQKGMFHFEEPG